MSLFVKICGLRSAADVEAAKYAGADAVGFVFADSVRRVTPAEAAAAARPAGHLARVAVMRHPTNDEWRAVLDEFVPDVLQTDAADLPGLDVPASVATWPVFREGGAVLAAGGAAWLYEGRASGAGETVDWTRAAELARRGHMILAGGLDPGNVARAVATVRPFGVDVSSGVESAPGRKDARLISTFIRAARAAEES